MINICKAKIEDSKMVAELFHNMWRGSDINDLQTELLAKITTNESEIFIAYNDDIPVGVAQCGLRKDYVEGTSSTPVGYLEGIYVIEKFRNNGIAAMLCKECEAWALTIGCKEFASDCELNNRESLEFHLSVGFTEANRIICFAKKIF
jgi:Acetyltransferases